MTRCPNLQRLGLLVRPRRDHQTNVTGKRVAAHPPIQFQEVVPAGVQFKEVIHMHCVHNAKPLRVRLAAALLFSAAVTLAGQDPKVATEWSGRLPLSFEPNYGQAAPEVKFVAHGSGYLLSLSATSAQFSVCENIGNPDLRMELMSANANTLAQGTEQLPGISNYFTGHDSKRWVTDIPTYSAVRYSNIYSGIDLVYRTNEGQLEYDFLVVPGADPGAIDLRFDGMRKLAINDEGALVLSMCGTEVIQPPPVVYEEVGGVRKTVPARYVVRAGNRVGFNIGAYDKSHTLVIDPTLVFSGSVGSGGAWRTATDAAGNVYVLGTLIANNGRTQAFISKLNPSLSAVLYTTYLSGQVGGVPYSAGDQGGLAVDRSGNAYVTGATGPDFPATPGAFQTSYSGQYASTTEAFVIKLNTEGNLLYSTYLGGSGGARGLDIAVDSLGNACVTGAAGTNFPTTPGALKPTSMSGSAFVAKLNAAGSALLYSTYLGENAGNAGNGIAVDPSGSAYVTGAAGPGFPTTAGAFQTAFGGQSAMNSNAFVTKLDPAGNMIYSTYVGGADGHGIDIAVGAQGECFVAGTASTDFPTTMADMNLGYGIFVLRLNAAGSKLVYSSSVGSSSEQVGAIAVDSGGNAYVVGTTFSPQFPVTAGAIQTTLRGIDPRNAFVTKFDPSGFLLYATFLSRYAGTIGSTYGWGIALDVDGNAYVSGLDWAAYAGGVVFFNAFLDKLALSPSVLAPTTTAAVNGVLRDEGWFEGPVTITLNATGSGSPVSATFYSVDNRPQTYTTPFSIPSDGIHRVLFYSIDAAGRLEAPHEQIIDIDTVRPWSSVAALPSTTTSPNFKVQWSGFDMCFSWRCPSNLGSGVREYTIYVSENGGPFTPWMTQTISTGGWFAGLLGHTYGFYSLAVDHAGNEQLLKAAADATTQVPNRMSADVNGDLKIDCNDIAIVKASFGKRAGQAGFDPRADVTGDGVVDVRDLAGIAQKLIPATQCP